MTARCVGVTFTDANAQRNLAGAKDVTRRVIPRQPAPGGRVVPHLAAHPNGPWWILADGDGRVAHSAAPFKCRYGAPGDHLWQREAWKRVPASAYAASPGVQQVPDPAAPDEVAVYRAGWDRSDGGIPWKPSIHMPHWATRTHRRILSVTAEPIQAITLAEIGREGYAALHCDQHVHYDGAEAEARCVFNQSWDSIHAAEPDRQWAANPWVWRVEYAKEDSPCPKP